MHQTNERPKLTWTKMQMKYSHCIWWVWKNRRIWTMWKLSILERLDSQRPRKRWCSLPIDLATHYETMRARNGYGAHADAWLKQTRHWCKGGYRLSNVFCGTAATAATNMMFESLRKNACGTNCRRGWAEPAFCGKECLCVHPENRQFLVRSAAIQLCLGTYL